MSDSNIVITRGKKWQHQDDGENPFLHHRDDSIYIYSKIRTFPKQSFSHNNHSDFVQDAINDLLSFGRITDLENSPYTVNPLTVAKNNYGKLWLFLGLRYVDKHKSKDKTKFGDWNIMEEYLEKEGFLFKLDIKQGYHCININENYQEFWGLAWEFEEKTKCFVFNVLPFGICSALFIFAKVMRYLVKFWRQKGLKISVFIDGGLGPVSTLEIFRKEVNTTRYSLVKYSFVINKSLSNILKKNLLD